MLSLEIGLLLLADIKELFMILCYIASYAFAAGMENGQIDIYQWNSFNKEWMALLSLAKKYPFTKSSLST